MKYISPKLTYILCFALAITSCKKTEHQLTKITAKNIVIDSAMVPSSEIDSIVAPFKKQLNAEMQQVFCYAPKKLDKNNGDRQSSLGNLMADMPYEIANPIFKEKTGQPIDFALFNHGGIRAIVPAGDVTKERAFKLMPFENELVVTTLTGDKMLELLDYFIKSKRAHPLSKEVSLTIYSDESYSFKINGKEFDSKATYNVLTSDYLQHGGSGMNFFKAPKKLTKLDLKLRDAILDYFKKVDTLKATIDNRVIIK